MTLNNSSLEDGDCWELTNLNGNSRQSVAWSSRQPCSFARKHIVLLSPLKQSDAGQLPVSGGSRIQNRAALCHYMKDGVITY